MLAEFLTTIFNRLDAQHVTPEIKPVIDPKDAATVLGYFDPSGKWTTIYRGPACNFDFPRVTVFSQAALIAYAKHHADGAITAGEAILSTNKAGLRLIIDYGPETEAQRRHHQVSFPAAFDEGCAAAASAIADSLNEWTALEDFDTLLDKCAPFILNFAALEAATSTMEGHESAKISKTQTGYQAMVTGEVSSVAEIPKSIDMLLGFMGNQIRASIPIRLKVENKQVQFFLVDNGALTNAQMAILAQIKAAVEDTLPMLLSIDGRIE